MEQQLMFPRLFEPIKIRNVEIKNRIVFLPHATVYAHFKRNLLL